MTPGTIRRFSRLRQRLAFAIVLAIGSSASLAATEATGTEFWLAVPENGIAGDISIQVLGSEGTTGTVEIGGLTFSEPFSIGAAEYVIVSLPPGAMLTASDGVESLGIHVTTDRPVVVYVLDIDMFSADTYLALPVPSLGTDYAAITYTADATFEAQIAVVATEDATQVDIVPTTAIGAHTAGVEYSVMLDAGEVYQGQSAGDLTGTTIVADHPVAVLSGSNYAQVPYGTSYADHLVEQLLPVPDWGTEAVIVPSAFRLADEIYRVLAGPAGATISLSTGGGLMLGAGGFAEGSFSAPIRFQADHPISVARFHTGGAIQNGSGDPALLVGLDVARFARGYDVATAENGTIFGSDYLSVVVPSTVAAYVRVDGVRINTGYCSAFAGTSYSSCQLPITNDRHRITAPQPFGVSIYGLGPDVAYASPAGGASLPFVDGFEQNDTHSWSAVVP